MNMSRMGKIEYLQAELKKARGEVEQLKAIMAEAGITLLGAGAWCQGDVIHCQLNAEGNATFQWQEKPSE
jgi:hypothetical protein